MDWLLSFVQTMLFLAAAPWLTGWTRVVKCRLQNRSAPSVWQPYSELRKLFGKNLVLPEDASWIFRATPYILLGSTVLAAVVVPLIAVHLPTAAIADVIVLVGFFALGRFFLALAGMDIGTSFGGMGSSREMTIASLAEPAVLMAAFTLAMTANSTNLSTAVQFTLDTGLVLRPSFMFIALGLMMVAVAETGRIPIDNPTTHLELTMLHEAMTLEFSGRHLALIQWSAQIKFMIFGVLIANIFLPWGIAASFEPTALLIGTFAIASKLAVLAMVLGVSEILLAKMRLFKAPEYLNIAYLLCLLGMLSHVILEVG